MSAGLGRFVGNRQRGGRDRRGASTVEFAVSAPLLFAIVFALLEMSRLFQLSGGLTTATILGAREASISTSRGSDISNEVRSTLARIGINQAKVSVSPNSLTPLVNKVTLRIEVPLTAKNGFIITEFVKQRSLSREISVDR